MKRTTTIIAGLVAAAVSVGPAVAAADSIKVSGSTTVQPLAAKLAAAYKGGKVTVTGGGSGAGIKCAADGTCDVGMSSRDQQGSDPSSVSFTPIARDAIVIVVNPKLGVSRLTSSQVKGIFTGQIHNWKEVGGKNVPISVYQRVSTSGTESKFKELFLGDKNATIPNAPAKASNGLVRTAVAGSLGGIGFVSLNYVETSKSVKPVSIDGVAPTLRNADSGRYKYVRTLYFVTKGAPSGAAAGFINFTRSAKGRAIVAKLWVPVS